jgi:hypothetical protein
MRPEIEIWLAKKTVLADSFARKLNAVDLKKYSDDEILAWAERIWESRMKYENENQIQNAIKTSEQKMAMLNTIQIPNGYIADDGCDICRGRGKVLKEHNGSTVAVYCGCLRQRIIRV